MLHKSNPFLNYNNKLNNNIKYTHISTLFIQCALKKGLILKMPETVVRKNKIKIVCFFFLFTQHVLILTRCIFHMQSVEFHAF